DVSQIGISAHAVHTDQVEQVQRGGRVVGDRALVHFDADFDADVGGKLTGLAQVLGGTQKILFGSGPTGPLGDLFALVAGARAGGMDWRTDHGRIDDAGASPPGVADGTLEASSGSCAGDGMR